MPRSRDRRRAPCASRARRCVARRRTRSCRRGRGRRATARPGRTRVVRLAIRRSLVSPRLTRRSSGTRSKTGSAGSSSASACTDRGRQRRRFAGRANLEVAERLGWCRAGHAVDHVRRRVAHVDVLRILDDADDHRRIRLQHRHRCPAPADGAAVRKEPPRHRLIDDRAAAARTRVVRREAAAFDDRQSNRREVVGVTRTLRSSSAVRSAPAYSPRPIRLLARQDVPSGPLSDRLADSTPGMRRRRSSTRSYSA